MNNRQIEIPVNNNENVFSRTLNTNSPTNSHIQLSESEKELQELKKKLTELKIRFDTSPNYYLRDDYQALIDAITSSLIHLYKDASHAQVITSWEEVVSNKTVPSAKLVKDTIDLIEQSQVWESGSGENSVLTKSTNCQAIGDRSVAEGEGSVAMGIGSHVEGHATKTFDTGIFAHAEGQNTNAYGQASHAEGGGSVAHNDYAHAEGGGTTALGISSHTEGDSTIANNPYEHAEGHYNESHSEDPNTWGLAGNTVHSIGIGNGLQNHKNAFEVMQNGDAYFIGLGGYDGRNFEDANSIQDEFRGVAKETNATANKNEIIQKIENTQPDLSSVAKETTLNLQSQAIKDKIDNIPEPDLSEVAKQGSNPLATNTAILSALHTDGITFATDEEIEEIINNFKNLLPLS